MLHYIFFGEQNARVGVALQVVPQGTNPVEMFTASPIIPPRPMPVECLVLFAPCLKQKHLPAGINLEQLRLLACELMRQGWHEAEAGGPDGPGPVPPIGRLTSQEFTGLREILEISERQPEDAIVHLTASKHGMRLRLRRLCSLLSRLRTEGQLAYASCKRVKSVA